jgi:hypothetical protein
MAVTMCLSYAPDIHPGRRRRAAPDRSGCDSSGRRLSSGVSCGLPIPGQEFVDLLGYNTGARDRI